MSSNSSAHDSPAKVQSLSATSAQKVVSDSTAADAANQPTVDTSSTAALAQLMARNVAGPLVKAFANVIEATEARSTARQRQEHELRTERQKQEHELQVLKLQQEHARLMQSERLQLDEQQKRRARTERIVYVVTVIATLLILAIVAALASGYLDPKVAGIVFGAAITVVIGAMVKNAAARKSQQQTQQPAINS